MRYCDLTFAYTETSGGIRTYIDEKRNHIRRRTKDEHVLIIPGKEDRIEWQGRLLKWTIASPLIPGCAPYRFFRSSAKIEAALGQIQPDVIELGSFFLAPKAAFQHRERMRAEGKRCLVSGYFHTDVAEAYFGGPLRHAFGKNVAQWSETLAQWGHRLGDAVEQGAEDYFGSIFNRCDLTFAATRAQARRLADYGVQTTALVPLGVDLETFHPDRRSEELRQRLGVGPDDVLLIYAGRLDSEKQPKVLVDAFTQLHRPDVHLVVLGEGPHREDLAARVRRFPRFTLLPYERDKAAFATLLASADIYVTAGPHETFGLSVVEAQASGLPVVGVAAGALIERVPEQVGRLGPVEDATAMARNIEEVAELKAEMGAAARQYVVSQGYSWTTTLENLLRHYQSALHQPDACCGGPGKGSGWSVMN